MDSFFEIRHFHQGKHDAWNHGSRLLQKDLIARKHFCWPVDQGLLSVLSRHTNILVQPYRSLSQVKVWGGSTVRCTNSNLPWGMACLQGETLGFTRRHIDCCFPELKKLAREAAPQWMTNQINDEPWKNSSIKDFNCYINCKST